MCCKSYLDSVDLDLDGVVGVFYVNRKAAHKKTGYKNQNIVLREELRLKKKRRDEKMKVQETSGPQTLAGRHQSSKLRRRHGLRKRNERMEGIDSWGTEFNCVWNCSEGLRLARDREHVGD